MLRSILHCDMNNFYASVECMLDPALKKYPIAVCGIIGRTGELYSEPVSVWTDLRGFCIVCTVLGKEGSKGN